MNKKAVLAAFLRGKKMAMNLVESSPFLFVVD